MLSFELAVLVWLLCVGALALWCRPTEQERGVLASYPAGLLFAGLLPFSRGSDELRPVDWRHFMTLRRRVWLSAAGVVLALVLVVLLTPRSAPVAAPAEPVPIAKLPATPLPSTPEPEPTRESPQVKRLPAPPKPKPTASELGWVTVTQEDQEALSEERTPTRLYAEARVRPVYANEDLLGVRILGIAPGSFWEDVGFREGDVVLEVNGELVDDPDASVYFMNSLSREYELILRVRGSDGNERILQYLTPPHF